MKYLLDTHTALWLFEGNEKLPQRTQNIIYNADIDIYVSIVSAWEKDRRILEGMLVFAHRVSKRMNDLTYEKFISDVDIQDAILYALGHH